MIIFHTILFLPSDIEMWGKQVNLYITWIIWSRVIACYEDNVCVLFQRYQQNNKNYIDSSTDWNLTGPWMHFLFSDLFCFPTHQEDKFQSNDTACFPFAKPKLIEYANFVRIFCFHFPIKRKMQDLLWLDVVITFYIHTFTLQCIGTTHLPAPSYQLTQALAPHIISQTKHTNINMKSWYIYDDFRIKYMIDPEYWLLLMLLHQVLLLVIVHDDHAWSFYS